MEQEIKKCPYCGEEILAAAKKCKHCGEWLDNKEAEDKEMMPCPICGEIIKEGTEKCPYCNEDIIHQEQETEKVEEVVSQSESIIGTSLSNKKIYLIAVIALLVIAGALWYFSHILSGSRTDTTEVSSAKQDVIKKAYVEILDKYKDEAEKTAPEAGIAVEESLYGYFLFDITGDGVPELWVQTGSYLQDIGLNIYTYTDKIEQIYKQGGSCLCSYYDNKDYILKVEVNQGDATWTTFRYDKEMKVEENYIGDLTEPENSKYREPTGTPIELIPLHDKSAIFSFFDRIIKDSEKTSTVFNDNGDTPHILSVTNVEYWDNLNDQGNNTYVPANMLDGNPSTAWAVDLDKASYDCDKLYGPIFTLKCKKISHIIIRNGYAKSKDSFKNNARASRIIFCNSANVSDEDEQSSYLYEGILKDTPDEQTLKISQDIPCNNNLTTVQIIFPVDGLRRGVKWNDLCVSEIEFYGYE